MNVSINICHRNRGYGPVPGQPIVDPRSPPANQGQPLGGMRPMSGNQPYQGSPPLAANRFNQPPYQPPPMNQQAGGSQVIKFRLYKYSIYGA